MAIYVCIGSCVKLGYSKGYTLCIIYILGMPNGIEFKKSRDSSYIGVFGIQNSQKILIDYIVLLHSKMALIKFLAMEVWFSSSETVLSKSKDLELCSQHLFKAFIRISLKSYPNLYQSQTFYLDF